MTTILADKNSGTSPGKLSYSIPNQPDTVHDLLLQKATGRFYLIVWAERFTGGSEDVVLNLGTTAAALFDPTLGSSPVMTQDNLKSIKLTLSNHPIILELR